MEKIFIINETNSINDIINYFYKHYTSLSEYERVT